MERTWNQRLRKLRGAGKWRWVARTTSLLARGSMTYSGTLRHRICSTTSTTRPCGARRTFESSFDSGASRLDDREARMSVTVADGPLIK